MSLPDGAEYWWGVKGKLKYQKPVSQETREADRRRNLKRLAAFPKHDCKPKAHGTPHRWRCLICNNRISKRQFKQSKEAG